MRIATITLNPAIDSTFAVDQVVPERKLDGRDLRRYPGGGGLNVARVLTRLGEDVEALWSRGGTSGDALEALLDGESLRHAEVPIEQRVRENQVVYERSTGNQYRFGLPGPTLSPAEADEWLNRVRQLPGPPDYVVVSGSLPGGVSEDWFAELIRSVPRASRVIVDTKRAALKRATEEGVYLVKPNLRELADLAGVEFLGDDVVDAARRLIDEGRVKVVVVSKGQGGALSVTHEGIDEVSAPVVPQKSKIGAGDSMVAGLVAGLARGWSRREVLQHGVAAGTAAVMTEGTELCRREDVERLYTQITRAKQGKKEKA